MARHQPERISAEEMRRILARGGIWPFFWSALSRGVPSLAEDSKPTAIVVNAVLAEPFRARGRVLIDHHWDRIIQGIRFLPRLLADYGRVEIILTAVRDPVARRMYADLSGYAWVRLHPVPVLYPVENPRILTAAVRRKLRAPEADDIWLIDVQGMDALGACLAEGLPLHERTVVTGGPGVANPRHHAVRIGTPIRMLAPETGDPGVRVLRGGLLTGVPLDGPEDAVQYDDDAFFYLPEASRRELLHFVRPGFNRTSYLPAFATALTGAPDRSISTSLRGEPRPCIACGLCEAVCPAGIQPQVLHRYLYRDAVEQAERAGLDRCVDCNLCTFVCPSKIELQAQFADARRRIQAEREDGRAAIAETHAPSEKEGAV
jgi:Na+-transporting NADH:ubiquinone oxidoreductase subunit A